MKIPVAFVGMLLCGYVSAAFGQTAPRPRPAPTTPRGFVSFNGLYQISANDFQVSSAFRQHAEDGRLTTDYVVKPGPAFNVGGGAMAGRRFGIGAGVSQYSRSGTVTLTAAVPHPFFFNRSRSVSGAASVSRKELAVHVQVRGVLASTRRLSVMAFVGPSFFQVTQDTANDFTFAESYPYDVATFGHAVTTSNKVNKMGFNAGADVAFFLSRHVGVGLEAGFAGTTVSLATADGGSTDVTAGGVRAGGGLRFRF